MKPVRSATKLQCLVLLALLVPTNTAGAQVPDHTKNCEAVSNANNSSGSPVGVPRGPQSSEEIGDATVVAIVDYEPFTPYHRDLYASHMPQHLDADPSNDLPLYCSPETWLPGFTTDSVDSFEPLNLSLEDHSDCDTPARADAADSQCPTRVDLSTKDGDLEKEPDTGEWGKVRSSGILGRGTASAEDLGTHMYWIPGSKVVGALSFGTQGLNFREATANPIAPGGVDEGHGVGSTTASVGNLHGTCPECLLVFISVDVAGVDVTNATANHDTDRMEQALEWAYAQDWIDVVSMPGTPSATTFTRERYYQASNLAKQAQASEAGKTIFFSSGNGQEAAGVAPSTTLQSSLQGPDWVVTVSGVEGTNDRRHNRPGWGKVVDISGLGTAYPTAANSRTVGGEASTAFANTSLAVASIAGMYAQSLLEARRAMEGPSRTQADGVVATGDFDCGTVRTSPCELGDGVLSATELRNRFFMGAQHSDAGNVTPIRYGSLNVAVRSSWEEDYISEGYGNYLGRCEVRRGGSSSLQGSGQECGVLPLRDRGVDEPGDKDDYMDVLEAVLFPLFGSAQAREDLTFEEGGRPPGEKDWFTVDSYCRQLLWGKWSGGIYKGGALPTASTDAPLREAYLQSCPLIPTPQHKVGDKEPKDPSQGG